MSFVTKDSGERAEFAGGMVRDTEQGKTLWHKVFDGPMLQRWAELLTRGAAKYPDEDDRPNWMKAEGKVEYNRFKRSAFRHFMQWFRGDTDEDHAAAVMFNINGAEYVKEWMDADEEWGTISTPEEMKLTVEEAIEVAGKRVLQGARTMTKEELDNFLDERYHRPETMTQEELNRSFDGPEVEFDSTDPGFNLPANKSLYDQTPGI